MADFSDAEDRHLVQIALKHELAGTPISWVDVAKRMKKWKNSKEKLRLRLKALKARFGTNICDFPQRLLETPRRRTSSTCAAQVPHKPVTDPQDAIAMETSTAPADASFDGTNEQVPAIDNSVAAQPSNPATRHAVNLLIEFNAILDAHSHRTPPDSSSAMSSLCVAAHIFDDPIVEDSSCYKIVEKMFQSVPRAAIRQKSGRPEQNMGEVCMVGVTSLLKALKLEVKDVFLDVGAGIGNVVAQVALQSRACKVVGIEIREHAVSLARRAISGATLHHRQLWKITLLCGDIRTPDTIEHRSVQESTVLYCFNTLFDDTSRVALESLACQLDRLRLVVVADKFCPRHERRQNCRNKFCTMWTKHEEVQIDVTYSSKPVSFSIFKRKQC